MAGESLTPLTPGVFSFSGPGVFSFPGLSSFSGPGVFSFSGPGEFSFSCSECLSRPPQLQLLLPDYVRFDCCSPIADSRTHSSRSSRLIKIN